MKRFLKKYYIYISVIILFYPSVINPQSLPGEYKSLYEAKEYGKALEQITAKLNEIYRKQVDDKRIPEQMISILNVGEKTDLVSLFRKSREKGFLIEDNPELRELHFYAGRCYVALLKKRDAVNHYIQSLRYSKFEDQKDDAIFYDISQVFRSMEGNIYRKGYLDALEQAYVFNKNNQVYSLELGYALFDTAEKKKSAYHFERYLGLIDEKPDPEIYLKLASLYESTKKYLNSEKYYNEYLREKSDDGSAHFALGYICYNHTGNYVLARSSFNAALKLLKEDDIYRISKCHEYLGDMSFSDLDYDTSRENYIQCIKYQELILEKIRKKKKEKEDIDNRVRIMKSDVIYKQDFNGFEEFELLQDEKGRVEHELEKLLYEFNNLNPGRVRWNLAGVLTKLAMYEDAIKYYRESIHFNYNANDSRDMITKLQLKISRGY